MLRRVGVKESMPASFSAIIGSCYYGIDTARQEGTHRANKSVQEIRDYLGVESLAYLSVEGLLKACGGSDRKSASAVSPTIFRPLMDFAKRLQPVC